MAKENKLYPGQPKTTLTNARTMEQQARIDKAREHYRTRAERRAKGMSQSDLTKYYPLQNLIQPELPHASVGRRRIPRETLQVIQLMRETKSC